MLLDEVRRRHPEAAIVYLALDEVVSTPEELARALVAETVRVAAGRQGQMLTSGLADEGLRSASADLGHAVLAAADGLLGLIRQESNVSASYGALLATTMRFPAAISEALNLPVLLMLDELQRSHDSEPSPTSRISRAPSEPRLIGVGASATSSLDLGCPPSAPC
jgi:hypothetical protein